MKSTKGKNAKNCALKTALSISASTMTLSLFLIPSFALAEDAKKVESQEEVIITATRRSEKLTDVPIAISVVGAKDIEQTGIRELSQVTGYIPNVQVSQHTDFRSAVVIRGVGSNSRNIGFDSRVGVYVDGIYMGQSPAINQELLDLARVEVLRGPQGMLFGKNNVAGAVSLVTSKPNDVFGGRVIANLGNFDHRELKGFLNVPLGTDTAMKFAISKTNTDGYVLNSVTGNMLNSKDVLAGRFQFRTKLSDNLEVNISADSLEADNLILVGEPLTDMLGLRSVPVNPEPNVVAFSSDPTENRKIWGAAIDVEYQLKDGYVFKSITGYRDTDAKYTNQTDYSPVPIISIDYTDQFKQTTQEFQLISPRDQKFTQMYGVYFYKQDAHTSRDVILGANLHENFIKPYVVPNPALAPLFTALGWDKNNLNAAQIAFVSSYVGFGPEGSKVFNIGDVSTESASIYFNGGYDIDTHISLGFGARFSTETKEVQWLLDGRNSGLFAIGSTNKDANGVPRPMINDRTDNFLSPALSVTYKSDGGTNYYAKYSTAYKSGGFNLDYINANELAANNGLQFDMETVGSYEIGMKGRYFDNKLSLNLAAFIADYEDYQVNQFVDLGGGRTSIRITNAAKVKTKGLEAEFSFKATSDLTFNGSIGLLDGVYDSFKGGGTAGADASGKKLAAPEKTASLSAIYSHTLAGSGMKIVGRLDANYSDGYFTTPDNIKTVTVASGEKIPFGYIPEQTIVNARFGINSANDKMGVFLWVKNLTDEDNIVDGFRDFFGTIVQHQMRPRTYGLELKYNF